MTRWGRESAAVHKRNPDLEDLPPLPRDFEDVFLQAAARLKDMANNIKEQRNKRSMQHFGGSEEQVKGRETVELMVPSHRAGLVIGHHGESLKRIEKMSQCKIQFDQHYNGNEMERRVIIVGFPEDIEEAKRLIKEKIDDPFSRYPTIQIMVPQGRVGLIIGKGGETIRELQEKSGAKITVQPESSIDPHSNDRAINVTGDEESIQRAKEMISELLSGQASKNFSSGGGTQSTSTHHNRNATTIQIPETCVGAVIGKRADILRTLQTMSGCRIYVEPTASPATPNQRNVHLTGAPEQVAYAHQLIMEKVSQHEAAASYYSSFDTTQPSMVYQNPADLISGTTTTTTATNTADPSYDYAQYYYQYYQQMAATSGVDPLAFQQQQQQQAGYDYSAYYNQYNPQQQQQQQQQQQPQAPPQ